MQQRLDEALGELERLRAENGRLRTLLELAQGTRAIIVASKRPETASSLRLDSGAAASEKVALIRDLFRSRETVYALRWENARTTKSGYVPATAGGWTRSGLKTYLPLTDEAIERHLRGRESIGIYPLFGDDSCWFLACDFDGGTWQLDALALLEACGERGVPAALERSRSGRGGHVWIFFSAPVAAGSARKLGALLLRDAMTRRAEVDLASYDRLFPNQDFLPRKGFGNLIALPLQGRCRAAGTCSSTRRRSSRGPINGRSSARSHGWRRIGSSSCSPTTRISRSVRLRSQRTSRRGETSLCRPRSGARSQATSRYRDLCCRPPCWQG